MISNMGSAVAQLLVRNLEDDVKRRLKARAQQHGRSTEEEVREILRRAVMGEEEPVEPLGQRFRLLFEGIGLDEEIPELRGQAARPADVR
jgi:plasmid stability protein